MMMLNLFEILFIDEAAVPIEEVEAKNFGLYILREGGFVNLVLYDTEKFYHNKINDLEMFDENPVYGFISLRNDFYTCGTYMVAKSAAISKFGPLMYDLGMSVIKAPIMSDRGSVSDKTQSVWNYMFTHSEKYSKINLPKNNDDCASYLKNHDKGVKLKNNLNYLNLYKNHSKLMNKLISEKDNYEKQISEELLHELGEHLFAFYNS